ncbi:unnamed protein product, partial [Rotaria sordida]
IAYQEQKRQEELSRYDPERDLPYDPLQPSIRAPDERIINENSIDNLSNEQIINEKNSTTEYIPSRQQHQVSGTTFRHDPNIESSTIENRDDDDDDEDVYDPNKPTLFQKIQPQTSNTTEQIQSTPMNVPSDTTAPKKTQSDEGKF